MMPSEVIATSNGSPLAILELWLKKSQPGGRDHITVPDLVALYQRVTDARPAVLI